MNNINFIYGALKTSLLRQAISEDAIRSQVPQALQKKYSDFEKLYRYYDHAERGCRICKSFQTHLENGPEITNPLEEQSYMLEIGDLIAGIAISFRATQEYKRDYMKNDEPCLIGEISGVAFDTILRHLGNGAAHVRTDPKFDSKSLVKLNNASAEKGTAFPPPGIAREVYSSWLISQIQNLIISNFIDNDNLYFKEVIKHIKGSCPDLLSFEPYLVGVE